MNDSLNSLNSLTTLQRENSLSSVLNHRRSACAKATRSVSQGSEQEGSIGDLTRVLDIKTQMSMKGIKFADNVEVKEISGLQDYMHILEFI